MSCHSTLNYGKQTWMRKNDYFNDYHLAVAVKIVLLCATLCRAVQFTKILPPAFTEFNIQLRFSSMYGIWLLFFGSHCKSAPSYNYIRNCWFDLEKKRMCFVFLISAKLMGPREPERKKPASLAYWHYIVNFSKLSVLNFQFRTV